MNNTPRQDQNSVVAVYSQHSAAEDAIKQLQGGGFDIKKLAVVGRDYQSFPASCELAITRNTPATSFARRFAADRG